jgi:hypothetical protein
MSEEKTTTLHVSSQRETLTYMDIYKGGEILVFRGENGELDEALAGLLASLRAGQTDAAKVDSVYTSWVEEAGWEMCAVIRRA